MKFFASMLIGLALILGISEPRYVNENKNSSFFILDKGDLGALYEFPATTCIVTVDGDGRTFDSYVEECLAKKHAWLKVNSERDAF